jgi:hypothetical protein
LPGVEIDLGRQYDGRIRAGEQQALVAASVGSIGVCGFHDVVRPPDAGEASATVVADRYEGHHSDAAAFTPGGVDSKEARGVDGDLD